MLRRLALLIVFVFVIGGSSTARAFSVQSAVTRACHEPVTAEALRRVRASGLGAPPLPAASRDERALLDDLPFSLDQDQHDFAAASLLLAVRDNDLKGNDPLETTELTAITSQPDLQREHCLRTDVEDEPDGTSRAIADCRAYIAERFFDALVGLDASGQVDAARRMTLSVALPIRGPRTGVKLPVFYVRIGQAIHAMEDSYTHQFRTPDGVHPTSVLNWIDFSAESISERRDGPAHSVALDDCEGDDPVRKNLRARAEDAATALLGAALGPGDKEAALMRVLDEHLTQAPACSIDNDYCNPAERAIATSGCSMSGADVGGALPIAVVLALMLCPRRGLFVLLLVANTARAQSDPPIVAPPGSGQIEPGREQPTPTRAELEKTRQKKKLGPRVGIAAAISGAVDRPALAAMLGLRVRLSERWLVGLDAEWNPFIGAENGFRLGVVNIAATGVLRYPLTWQRVNLRTTLSLGTSVQLLDVYGAARGSVGVYAGVSLLGVDIDVGHFVRVVIDPTNISIPAPHLVGIPFYYIQYRLTIGITWGA